MADAVLQAVNQFIGSQPQSDDLTLVIIQRDGTVSPIRNAS